MQYNALGKPIGANGYADSILQDDLSYCFLCGRRDRKLDRHEVYGSACYRKKSKADGLWVMLCHDDCHEGRNGVHGDAKKARELRRLAQTAAMQTFDWSEDQFRMRYGKSYL